MIFTFILKLAIAKPHSLLYNTNMGIFSFLKRKKQKPIPSQVLGLALSGGGAKGFAHVGVLRAIEESELNFDVVVGTSVGSLVGALYSAGVDSYEMEKIGKSLKTGDILDKKFFIAPSKSQNIEKLVKNVIGDIEFKDLNKKFACCATNMLNGQEVVLQAGKVATAVSASCSAPIFFDGVETDGMRLFDGGLVNNLPADLARQLGANIVVGVTLSNTGTEGTEKTNPFSIAKSTFNIISRSTSIKGLMNSDLLIAPVLTNKRSSKLEGIESAEEMIKVGYEFAKLQIPKIYELLNTYKG